MSTDPNVTSPVEIPSLHDIPADSRVETSHHSAVSISFHNKLDIDVVFSRLPAGQMHPDHWLIEAKWRAPGDEASVVAVYADLVLVREGLPKGGIPGQYFRLVAFKLIAGDVVAGDEHVINELLAELTMGVNVMVLASGGQRLQVIVEDTLFADRAHRFADFPADDLTRQYFASLLLSWGCREVDKLPDCSPMQPRQFMVPAMRVQQWLDDTSTARMQGSTTSIH